MKGVTGRPTLGWGSTCLLRGPCYDLQDGCALPTWCGDTRWRGKHMCENARLRGLHDLLGALSDRSDFHRSACRSRIARWRWIPSQSRLQIGEPLSRLAVSNTPNPSPSRPTLLQIGAGIT